MNVVLIFLVILSFLIIIGILIDKSNIFSSPEPISKNKQYSIQKQQGQLQTNAFLPYPTWSQPSPFPGPTGSGLCNIYTFLGGSYIPGVPNYQDLNNEVKNNLIQPTTDFVCIDPDQLFANTVSHECINSQGLAAGSGCILTVPTCSSDGYYRQPGEFVPNGTIEGDNTISCLGYSSREYYAPCIPSTINNNIAGTNYCIGNIGLIIPDFNPQAGFQPIINQCVAGLWFGATGVYQNQIYNTAMANCNLSDSTQIFRMIRYSLDENNNLQQDDKGNLASYVHRYTGYYLAPDFGNNIIPSGNSGPSSYNFYKPNIQYQNITDTTGNDFKTYINMVLINPSNDTTRNGVYWLLQNQTPDPVVNPQTLNFTQYANRGIIPTQTNYATQYKPANTNDTNHAPAIPSYFIEATVKVCESTPSNPGCVGTIPTLADLSVSTGYTGCFFDVTPTVTDIQGDVTTGTSQTVDNIPFPESPQQIVYIPDLNLLPNFSTANPSVAWTYLINNFSINSYTNGSGDLVPILTPYRQSRNITVNYNCINDTNSLDNNTGKYTNFFTQLTPAITTPNILSYYFKKNNGTFTDSQFINYASFIQQIQTPVSQNYENATSQYAKNSNPFNI